MKELSYIWSTGQTGYFTVRDKATKLIANGSGLEQYISAHYSTYKIVAAEDGSSGSYYGNFPTYLPEGEYVFNFYIQAGAQPAEGDQNVAEVTYRNQKTPAVPPITGLPTAGDVRANLEGFDVSPSIVSDDWINAQMARNVVPWVEQYIRNTLLTAQDVTEFYGGNGTQELILNRKPINSLVDIKLVSTVNFIFYLSTSSVEVVSAQGLLKIKAFASAPQPGYAFFPRGVANIKVTYNYGFGGTIPGDIGQALVDACSVLVLRRLANETGGGSLSTPGFSRNFGEKGKFTDYRVGLSNQVIAKLKKYVTQTVGA